MIGVRSYPAGSERRHTKLRLLEVGPAQAAQALRLPAVTTSQDAEPSNLSGFFLAAVRRL